MSAGATHDTNITVTVTLAPAATQVAGFGNVLLLVPLATNSLNGLRVAVYTSYEDMQTARTAGYISAATLEAGRVAFAQRPKIAKFKVGYVDLAAGTPETYSTALTACIAFDSDFYGVCLDSRVAATITALGATIEAATKRMILVAQNSSSSWLASGLPAGITGARDRTAYVYHSADSAWNDVAWACNRLSFDPDTISAPWDGHSLSEVAAITPITEAQRLFVIGNYANLGLPLGGSSFVMDPGVNSDNRPLYEIVTTDWFATRLRERLGAMLVKRANAGQKVPVSAIGQTLCLGVIQGLYDQATAGDSPHFIVPDEDDAPIVAEDITDADRAARTMRFTVRGQIAVSARKFTINLYASTDALSA